MPAVIDTEQDQGQEQIAATKEKSGKRGRTRTPPKTLPADFDFGDTPASTSTASPAAPPKTLPADFDFDKEVSASSVKPRGGKSARPAWMSSEPAPAVAEFNRKQSIIDDWLAVKRDVFAANSKVKIPDLPPELQEFARKAGYPQFQPGSPEYGHFGTPIDERMSTGIVERNIARLKRVGAEIGGAAGESFLNPASEAEMRQLEQTSPKGAQTLKNIGAVGRSFGSTVGGLVADPTNIALMGSIGMLPRLGQRMVALGFAGMIGKDVYHQSGQLGAIWDRTDIPQELKVELMTNMILNTALATVSATHGVRKGEPTAADRENIEEQMLGEIDKLGKDAADQIAFRIKKKLTIKEKLQAGMQHAAGTGTRLTEKVTEKAVADTLAANEAAREKAAKIEAKNAEAQSDYDTKISRINEDFDAKIAKTKQQHAEVQTDYSTKVSQINEDFDAKISKVKQQYADDVAERDKKVSELQAQHVDATAQARREWVEKTYAGKETERAQAKIEGRREALRSQQKAYAGLIKENVQKAHANARASLDARWNALREQIGTETPVSPAGIYGAVEASRAMLAGVPADLKIFNDVFREITEPDTSIESPEGPKPAPREYISFDSARTQYSAIGEKAYAAEGNLRRALFNVYAAYDKALSKTAADAGAGKQYTAVKRDWSGYMKDWHDMSSTATGGSPLARVYRAVDNPVISANVTGKFGDRLFATFARYDKYGANPLLMSKLRNSFQELSTLPKSKAVKLPGKFEPPAEPKLPESVDLPSAKVAELEHQRSKMISRIEAPTPIESPTGKVAELESARAKTIERTEKPLPVKLPALTPAPTVAEMVDTVRRAKIEKAKDFAAGQKWHPYDLIMGSWVAFGLPDAAIEGTLSRATVHAAVYFGVRVGWMKFVRSPVGMEWMTKVTPADIDTINRVLSKYPSERTEAGKAITSTLEDTIRAGGPSPNVAKFGSILTPEQKREIMKTVKDINELKALGITPPDVTAKASTEGRVVGTPSAHAVPESSIAAGGSGTKEGAAADNADIAQARKNLGLAPGQWDLRLLSEAQRLKDARISGSQGGQGGHAGGGVSSVEELSRSGVNYVVSKSGQITYHGKSFVPESTPAGSSHVTVLPNGSIRVNGGSALNPDQEAALRKALDNDRRKEDKQHQGDNEPKDVLNTEIGLFKKIVDVPNDPTEVDARMEQSLPPFLRNLRAVINKSSETRGEYNSGDVAHVPFGSKRVLVDDPRLFYNGVLAHEMTHVFQNTRQANLDDARGLDYGGAEGLREARRKGEKISKFSREEQAAMVEDYYRVTLAMMVLAKKQGDIIYKDQAKWYESQKSAYEPYMKELAELPEYQENPPNTIDTKIPAPSGPNSDVIGYLELSPTIAGILPFIPVRNRPKSISGGGR